MSANAMSANTLKAEAVEVTEEVIEFANLGLSEDILRAIADSGYTTPTEIQRQMIPHVLAGRDVLGQAQTGTGKTAAFALPLLARLSADKREPQVLVLAPTRELALQVSESFKRYATHIPGFSVAAIYGGQAYPAQLRDLKRGVQVVVGTPGRIMDHMRRGTLSLNSLDYLVLDEADEMLRMGFAEDVEWIVDQIPESTHGALFSATMPTEIRRVAQKFLESPVEISIGGKTSAATTIRQRFWQVSGQHKLDALTRILEVEDTAGVLIFVRTKTATAEVADNLLSRGFKATALNGDIAQNQREMTIESLRSGRIDIVVATDVAARGIDVERISHVINYDAPYDSESYIHRIGRTGRAGRSGEAIIFIAPKEGYILKRIEKVMHSRIEPMTLPTVKEVNQKRIGRLKEKIQKELSSPRFQKMMPAYMGIVHDLVLDSELSLEEVAAALITLSAGKTDFLLNEERRAERESREPRREYEGRGNSRDGRGSSREARPYRERRDSDSRGERRPYRDRGESSGRGDRYRPAEKGQYNKPRDNSEQREFSQAAATARAERFGSEEKREYTPRKPAESRRDYSAGETREGSKAPRSDRFNSDEKRAYAPRGERFKSEEKRPYAPRKTSDSRREFSAGDAGKAPRSDRFGSDEKRPYTPRGERFKSDEKRPYAPRKTSDSRRDFSAADAGKAPRGKSPQGEKSSFAPWKDNKSAGKKFHGSASGGKNQERKFSGPKKSSRQAGPGRKR
ncbi:MAG: DEAD/DEAH box helicase [bacterium]|nr:DEAD/DEAH box helicase [bacterium]